MAQSFRLAADIQTHKTVWILDKNGEQIELDPIQVCAQYRQQFASDVTRVTF